MTQDAFLQNLLASSPLDQHMDRFQRRLWETRAEVGLCRGPWVANSARGPMVVPCGNCFPCKVRKRSAAIGLAMAELHSVPCAEVYTLTYDDGHLPDFTERTVGQEWDRIRKRFRALFGPFRYWWVFQLGTSTSRPHWHVIIWYQVPRDLVRRKTFFYLHEDKVWPEGGRTVDVLTPASARYVLAYLTDDKKGTVQSAHSRHLGEVFIRDWIDREVSSTLEKQRQQAASHGLDLADVQDDWPVPYPGFVLDGRSYPFTRKLRLYAQEKGLLPPLSERDREDQLAQFVLGGGMFGDRRGAAYVSEMKHEQDAHAKRLALADLSRNLARGGNGDDPIVANDLAEFRTVQAELRRRRKGSL